MDHASKVNDHNSLTVQGQIFHGKRTCSTIISKHYTEMREGLENWYNEFRGMCGSFPTKKTFIDSIQLTHIK
jgi:hypothetical protein